MLDSRVPFAPDEVSLAAHGGKGAGLARLTAAGFPVPAWYIIATHRYRDYVSRNGLDQTITAALAGLDGADVAGLESAAATIRNAFAVGRWPEPAWQQVLAPAAGWTATPLAVRSSATAEDLPEASFAGQQDTFLNVVGEPALRAAVVACFASLWTARAIGYRLRNRVDQAQVALAVVVQVMVPAQTSGVLFTANPLTGLRAESVIDATYGLGEALVSGQVEPDHWVVDTSSGRIRERKPGAKQAVTVAVPGGGVRLVDSEADRGLCLTDAQVAEVVGLGARVAQLVGSPQDIEWAYADGRLHLVQSRAITTLFDLPDFTPTARSPLAVWFSFGAVQGLLDPLTPLGQDTIGLAVAGAGRLFGGGNVESNAYLRAAGERLWLRLDLLARNPLGRRILPIALPMVEPSTAAILQQVRNDPRLAPLPGRPGRVVFGPLRHFLRRALPRLPRSLLNPIGQRGAFESAALQCVADVAETEALAVGIAEPRARLAARVGGLRTQIGNTLGVLLPRFAPIMGLGLAMISRLNRLAAQAGEAGLGLECLRGLDGNVTTEMDLTLWQVARTIQADAPSLARFVDDEADTLAADYHAGLLPAAAQAAVQSFLATYGMRGIAEIDLGRSRWSEDATQVLNSLRSYVRIETAEQAPDALFAAGQRASRAATERLAAVLGRPDAIQARFLVSRIRGMLGARETPKFTIIKAIGIIRSGMLASGADLVAAGLLDRADDVFFLRVVELEHAWTLDSGHLRALIAARRAVDARERRRTQVPRVILSDGRTFYEGLGNDPDGALSGSPASPGVGAGRVRVITDPAAESLSPGEILVCRATDPAWTPLFLSAAGLVLEVGGMMTHGSVVAREYGIPAVVGVHDATRRLTTGQYVRLDGTQGTVEILEDPHS
ncbi:MAG: PEP/pyruvate-binding domain-containing protein [Propionibacteriaceae bacterium]